MADVADDDVTSMTLEPSNPFCEPQSPSSSSSTSEGIFLSRLHTSSVSGYFRKLSSRASRRPVEDKMAETGSKGGNVWTGVVHVVVVSSCHRSIGGVGTDVYVKFKLANERYKTQYQPRTSTIRWQEQFELCLYPDSDDSINNHVLDVRLRSRDIKLSGDDVIGRATLDIAALEKNVTHDTELELDNDAGVVRLLVTVSDTTTAPTETQQPADRRDITRRYGLLRTLCALRDVGWLEVTVIQAVGLAAVDIRGTSDPYCVLQLVNSRRRTHTEYRNLSPNWNRTFTFEIADIHTALEIFVYDENPDKKVDFLGRISIPILRMCPGEKRWYQLKDQTMSGRVKGSIELQFDVVFNDLRAAVRTFNPRDPQYTKPAARFRLSVLKHNAARVSRIAQSAGDVWNSIVVCLEWQSKLRSAAALLGFIVIVLFGDLYMLPAVLLTLFIKNLVMLNFNHALNPPTPETELNESDLNQDIDDKDGKMEKKGIMDRLHSIQDVCLQIQESTDAIASLFERAKNSVTWVVPWMSWLAVVILIIMTIVFYFVPLRYIILTWGIIKFTNKLRQPNTEHHIGLLDYLNRLPSDRELVEYREYRSFNFTKKKQL